MMTYSVKIVSSGGREHRFLCAGPNDQVAMIYAGKVVEAHADRADLDARVRIDRDGTPIGPRSSVAELTRTTV